MRLKCRGSAHGKPWHDKEYGHGHPPQWPRTQCPWHALACQDFATVYMAMPRQPIAVYMGKTRHDGQDKAYTVLLAVYHGNSEVPHISARSKARHV